MKSLDDRVNCFQHIHISGHLSFCRENDEARLEAQPGVINKNQKKAWARIQRIQVPVVYFASYSPTSRKSHMDVPCK